MSKPITPLGRKGKIKRGRKKRAIKKIARQSLLGAFGGTVFKGKGKPKKKKKPKKTTKTMTSASIKAARARNRKIQQFIKSTNKRR